MALLQSERVRWILTAALIALVALIVLRSMGASRPREATTMLVAPTAVTLERERPAPSPTEAPALAVDVIGAVQQPGVYYLGRAARVVDAVEAAGGLAPDADRERINLAQHVADGQQVRVPRVGDGDATPAAGAASVESAVSRLIDLNAADTAQFESLPGIGPVTAQAIVSYRASNGPFGRVEELQEVKGIGPSTLERLREHVTIGP
jgi:competence protein ComEA